MNAALSLLPVVLLIGGIAGGIFANRLPINGPAAVGLATLPLAGVGCTLLWC